MIDLESTCVELHAAIQSEKALWVDWEPFDPDSTTLVNLTLKLKLQGLKGFKKTFDLNTENFFHILRLIETVFSSKKIFLIGYNFKNLFSFYKRLSKRPLKLSNFIDLYWYESYVGVSSSKGDKAAGLANFYSFIRDTAVFKVYNEIYVDLISSVVPSMESFLLVNDDTGKVIYSNYHIEGQDNGRLSCSCDKRNVFNPHSLGEEKRHFCFFESSYKYFLQFDYRNMEVSVLAVLSQDKKLLEIVGLESISVYETIFELITGIKNHADAKSIGKKLFLPLIYGQTHTSLAKCLDISTDQAEIYYNKTKNIFKDAFEFVSNAQKQAVKNGFLQDCFFRKRYFVENEGYKGRNFIIQSPSALICLEALLKLYRAANDMFAIAFHVHDGYFLAIKKDNIQDAFYSARKILESKTELMPALNLRSSAKIGKSLDKMVFLDKEKKV